MPSDDRRADAELDRRTFLKRSAGALAILAVGQALRLDAAAQERRREGYRFFTREEGELMEALVERFWPEDDRGPGAREAGVVNYIDNALFGAYGQYQHAYRVMLHDLTRTIRSRFGIPVTELDDGQLDLLLGELEEQGDADDDLQGMPSRQIELGLGPSSRFDMLHRHVMEGLFSDPVHGGNRDFAGWRAVGYPGAHYVYSAEEQQVFEPLAKPYQSVADL